MERKDFISLLGLGAGSVIITSCLGACVKSETGTPNPNPGPGAGPGKLDFTLDVSTNSEILNKGWTIQSGVIIAKNGANYLALSAACTHAGSQMTYEPGSNTFPCSLQGAGHGSAFDASGVKLRGPATGNLKKYNTDLTGNSLRVFEA